MTKTITPTDLNLTVLTDYVAAHAATVRVLEDGAIAVANGRIEATDASHMRRLVKAGWVVVVSKTELQLTPACAAVVARRMRVEANRFYPDALGRDEYRRKMAEKYAAGCRAIGC